MDGHHNPASQPSGRPPSAKTESWSMPRHLRLVSLVLLSCCLNLPNWCLFFSARLKRKPWLCITNCCSAPILRRIICSSFFVMGYTPVYNKSAFSLVNAHLSSVCHLTTLLKFNACFEMRLFYIWRCVTQIPHFLLAHVYVNPVYLGRQPHSVCVLICRQPV